jgi:predicted regulator of Ras-like GTPase activity (Roadblock/LC7/MglB family)
MLEEIASIQGVRGALIATPDGAVAKGRHSGLEERLAHDIAKTIRRMVVASATVGAPVEELVISFGPARLLVVPLRDDATLAVLMDKQGVVSAVQSILRVELDDLREMLSAPGSTTSMSRASVAAGGEAEDELDRLLQGPLGPLLRRIEASYVRHATASRLHAAPTVSVATVREQLREWLNCCNPSSYNLPLLLDGLSQTLNANPNVRAAFSAEMEGIVKASQGGAS